MPYKSEGKIRISSHRCHIYQYDNFTSLLTTFKGWTSRYNASKPNSSTALAFFHKAQYSANGSCTYLARQIAAETPGSNSGKVLLALVEFLNICARAVGWILCFMEEC